MISVVDDPMVGQEGDSIRISGDTNWQEVEAELIKRLQLDSVWVGLLYRIGTDIYEFQQYLVEHEHFEAF